MTDSTQHVIQTVNTAITEIQGFYQAATTNKPVKGWTVSDDTDKLLSFRTKYTARLTASAAIGTNEELRGQLIDDLRQWLNYLYAIKDYVDATHPTDAAQIDLAAAKQRYEVRTRALEVVLDSLLGAHGSLDTLGSIDEARSEFYKFVLGKSEREIFQVISRILPTDQAVDDQVTELFYLLIQQAHNEPAIQALVTDDNSLVSPARPHTELTNLASSQAMRDYAGPYLAALVKKALADEDVEPFDESFRSTYFAVVNRVINYYQEWTPAAVAQVNSEQPTVSGSPQPTPQPTQAPAVSETPKQPTTLELMTSTPSNSPTPQPSEKKTIQGTNLS